MLAPNVFREKMIVNSQFSGCLNGVAYSYDAQFPCGSMDDDGDQPLYDWETSGCCAQGLAFNVASEFCCYDGVHSYDEGECVDWDASFNSNCYCDGSLTAPQAEGRELSAEDKIDTSEGSGDGCVTANSTFGCLNAYSFNFTDQYPCGSWILRWSTMGCFNGSPYSLTWHCSD